MTEPSNPLDPTRTATVVAVDVSWSTALTGCFDAIKGAAVALDEYARSHFAEDIVTFVAFSAYARPADRERLAELKWDESVLGSNQHAAFLLAAETLDKEPAARRRLIMLTDGEPTAHLEKRRSLFAYPPSSITFRETIAALRACTEAGIAVTMLMIPSGHKPPEAATIRSYGRHIAEIPGVSVIEVTRDTLTAEALAAFAAGRASD